MTYHGIRECDPDLNSGKIRVGVLLESHHVPAWQFAVLESLLQSDVADIAVLILQSGRTAITTTRNGRTTDQSVIYKAFMRVENRNYDGGPDACALTNTDSLLRGVNRITLARTTPDTAPPTLPESMQQIRQHDLDLVVALTDPALIDDVDRMSRWGIWYFGYDGHPVTPANGFKIGFGEVIRRRPYLQSALLVRRPGLPEDLVAVQTTSAVNYQSHLLTRNQHLWKCSTFVSRALGKCNALGGESYLQSLPVTRTPAWRSKKHRLASANNTALLFPFMSYLLWRAWQKVIRRLYAERWILLFGARSDRLRPAELKELQPPKGRFWADPYVLFQDGAHYVFFEDASLQTGIGHISVMIANKNGQFGTPKTVIQRPYHLSYPFVFEWRGEHYLVPESAENRTIELYRCIRFPDQWEFQYNLMEDVWAYDATLIKHAGLWWLFANKLGHEGASSWDELSIFFANTPLSRNWQPHPENPVISDVRRARPAGSIFRENGRLYRPSQNCSKRYGYALNINEILELTKNSYKETTVETIKPGWHRSIRAVHSYSCAESLVMMDAIYRGPRRC